MAYLNPSTIIIIKDLPTRQQLKLLKAVQRRIAELQDLSSPTCPLCNEYFNHDGCGDCPAHLGNIGKDHDLTLCGLYRKMLEKLLLYLIELEKLLTSKLNEGDD